jgi:D-3-phosphoglycerate dehydrogenase
MSSPTSFPRERIRITLLENIHPAARETLVDAGYSVEVIPRALDGDELNAVVAASHVLGVRSRTKLRAAQLEHANKLLAIGCFSVGTDQVAINEAAHAGVPVFNAPHASTRSVAELTIGNIIALARRIGDKNNKLHRGEWDKSLSGAHEVRGRSFGIVGYGHIGQQVGLLAEAFGMRVVFHDIQKKLPLGLCRPVNTLDALLEQSDFLSLHVPDTPAHARHDRRRAARPAEARELRDQPVARERGRRGVAACRAEERAPRGGGARRLPDRAGADERRLRRRLRCAPERDPHAARGWQHRGGAARHRHRGGQFVHRLHRSRVDRGGGELPAREPAVAIPETHRILNIHRNVPGALAEVNKIVSEVGANIEAQQLATTRDIGYLVMDVNRELSDEVNARIAQLPMSVRTRILY